MRFRSAVPFVLVSLLAACGSTTPSPEAPAPAERAADSDQRWLEVGEVATGMLTLADPTWGGHGPFHAYRFRAAADDRVEIRMSSDAFDTYLVVGDEPSGVFNWLMEDDDSGGNLDSRIRFTAPHAGIYTIVAQAYSDEGAGMYTLSLQPMPEPRRAVPVALAADTETWAELVEGDAMDEWEEKFVDVFTFEGLAGRRYAIEMSSPSFDTYASVGLGMDDEFVELASNDDSDGTTDSRIVFTPEESGTYVIRATSFYGQTTGEYSVLVSELPPPAPLVATPLAPGLVSASLEESDAMNDDGSYFDVYSFEGREGQRIAITMRSEMLDSYLELGEPAETSEFFYAEYSDDDSGGDLDARIVATLWHTGTYHVHASSLFGDQFGLYTIELEELPQPGPPTVRTIEPGQTIQGTLEITDALDGDQHYDIYTFRGSAGQRVRITHRSEDFDAYLMFGRWIDNELDFTDSDDDGGGNLDSMLELTLPVTATYAIQATSLGAGDTGSYSVTLELP